MPDESDLNGISERVIGAAFKVSNSLGCGFLEKVYENALAHELNKNGSRVGQQHAVPVY
jgi:GxxExxY protein